MTEIDEGLPDIAEANAISVRDDGDLGLAAIRTAVQLSSVQKQQVQRVLLEGAQLLLRNAASVHYTQDMRQRWEGIAHGLRISRGDFPHHGDCSSTVTWLYWNALRLHLGMGDVVNGQEWRSGYTGTMLNHGTRVAIAHLDVGDAVIYGASAPGSHVAMYVGGGMVFSHGSEPGPYKLAVRYRSDILDIRRYF